MVIAAAHLQASLSTISASRDTLPADAVSEATITVQLRSADGEPSWGKTVLLVSSRGDLDEIIQPSTVTDANGMTSGTIHSGNPGTATVAAIVMNDGVVLDQMASVEFESYDPPEGAFLFQLNRNVDTSMQALSNVAGQAEAVADHGDYFRNAIEADEIRRDINTALNLSDIYAGAADTRRASRAWDLALPGMRYSDGPLWSNIGRLEMYPDASHLFRTDVWYLTRYGTSDGLAEEIFYTGLKFFAAELRDSGMQEITQQTAQEAVAEIFAERYNGMSAIAYPAVHDTSEDLSVLLDQHRDYLLSSLPAMSTAYQGSDVLR